MILRREVTVGTDPKTAFAYLSDFTTTTEWDPGTIETTRISGDGGVGTLYHNRTQFGGRETELTYEVIERRESMIRLRGENKTVVAVDTITVESSGKGSRVIYEADFTFKGIWKLVEPFLRPAFRKLGDEAETGLRETLGRLGPSN
ncbi:MAG: SRPBCC family protein [Demequinaceae bacterium]|nr:SRPBCC family protein [Demequinaceae bacterium]